jgi:hypothetical protein
MTIWLGAPITASSAVLASYSSTTLAPSLAKRQQEYTELHEVTLSSPHLTVVHTRPHKTSTHSFYQHDPITKSKYDYLPAYDTTLTTWSFDHVITTDRLWNVNRTLSKHSTWIFYAPACHDEFSTSTYSDAWTTHVKTTSLCHGTTVLSTRYSVVPYTTIQTISAAAPSEHSTLVSRLADIAFCGSDWERVRYTKTCSHPTPVEVLASNTISGLWTETTTWCLPHATKTWTSYHQNFVCDFSFFLFVRFTNNRVLLGHCVCQR